MAIPVRTVRQIIQKALQKLGVYASGETIPAGDMNDGLVSFQDMIAEWSADGLLVTAVTQDSFPLVGGQSVYTIGEDTADITTARPDDIIRAFVRSGTTDFPVKIIDERSYASFQDKSNGSSMPEYLWYNPTAPNGTITLYRPPSGAYTMFISSLKAFPDNSGLTDNVFLDLGIPRYLNNPLIYNLAVELAPEYGVSAGELQLIAARSESGKDRIRSLAASNRAKPSVCEFAVSNRGNEDLVRYI